MKTGKVISLALALLVSACTRTQYTRTGSASPLPEGCPVATFTTTPQVPYVEVGVVEFSTVGGGMAGVASTVSEARERAVPYVCREGANGLIMLPGPHGYIERVTLIRTGVATTR